MPNGKGFRGGIEFKEIQNNFNQLILQHKHPRITLAAVLKVTKEI